jgi:hypothetical protein
MGENDHECREHRNHDDVSTDRGEQQRSKGYAKVQLWK